MYLRFMKWMFFGSCILSLTIHAQSLRIAFGSCSHQNQSLPILKQIGDMQPDYFIYLGDNIYGDTRDSAVLASKYAQLASNPNYQYLKSKTKVLATWDDHDYGENDAGKYYPMKDISKDLFLRFFEEPQNSSRYDHPGIYTSYEFKKRGQKIQLILLDMRTFRSNLCRYDGNTMRKDSVFFYDIEYVPCEGKDSTFLGEAQWIWLEQQLSKKADLRIIASSTQFGHSYNGYESWNNFPSEKQRMSQLILKTKAEGVFFISGDVHYAELSEEKFEGIYPLYDLTASGLSQSWHFATPNSNRIQGPVMENHFGYLDIDVRKKVLTCSIIDGKSTERIQLEIPWKSLRFNDKKSH